MSWRGASWRSLDRLGEGHESGEYCEWFSMDYKPANPPTAYCLHTGPRPVYDLLGDGILLGGAWPAESTHTAFISIISSPSTTLTSSVPVTLGLLTHCRNLSMVAGSILYSLYTLDGSDPAGKAFNRSSSDIKSVAVR